MKTIEYKVSYEKMISRIPGLFAYLESDEYGVVSLHKATDSLDGCWGKIVENIKLPNYVNLTIDGNNILNGGETHTYRTIIDYYYQYREELIKADNENPFVKFVEKAIGKVEVPRGIRYYHVLKEDVEDDTLSQTIFEKDYQLLSDNDKKKYYQTPRIYEAMPYFLYLSNVKRLYNELVKTSKKCDFYSGCKDDFCDDKYLCCLCENYEKIGGNGFKRYVGDLIQEAEKIAEEYKGYAVEGMTLDFDIDLTSTYQDLGIMTPYAPIWLPYKRYYKGDKVIYNNELYRCTKENSGIWDEELLSVVFDENSFEIVDNEMGVFDTDPTDPDNPQKGHKIDLPQGGYPIKNRTDSKLVDLRRFVTFYDDNGVASLPKGEDWLFYYRVGVPVNIKTLNDDLGNIVKLSDNPNDLAAYGDVIESINYLYTNGVSDITNKEYDNLNEDEKADFNLKYSIRFTYRVGAHLKGENMTPETDSDGNELVKWGKFVWDGDEKTGIKYEEEYTYDIGSDLDKLIKGEFTLNGIQESFTFNGYIQGQYDKKLKSFNFAFRTDSNRINYDRQIANQDVNIVSLMTDYTIYRKDFDEYANNELFREDYFNGITYKPTKVIDVNINRGSTSVFDKHMAFGSVKTLEDMIEYKNGSFFKMSL